MRQPVVTQGCGSRPVRRRRHEEHTRIAPYTSALLSVAGLLGLHRVSMDTMLQSSRLTPKKSKSSLRHGMNLTHRDKDLTMQKSQNKKQGLIVHLKYYLN